MRALWASLSPVALLVLLAFLNLNTVFPTSITALFTGFLPLSEAESLLDESLTPLETPSPPPWINRVLSFLALIQTVAWFFLGYQRLNAKGDLAAWDVWTVFLVASTWCYATWRPFVRSHSTSPPYDLFALYLIHLTAALVEIGVLIFNWYILNALPPNWVVLVAVIINLAILLSLIGVVLTIPLAIPSNQIDKEKIVGLLALHFTSIFPWY